MFPTPELEGETMNAAGVLIEETTDTCEACIAVMNSNLDQTETIPAVCPECHVDWLEWTVSC
jgi:hypothetical protein